MKDFKPYLFEYRYDGAEWSIEIMATSRADAEQRIRALTWARYKGELVAKIPVPAGNLIRRALAAIGVMKP